MPETTEIIRYTECHDCKKRFKFNECFSATILEDKKRAFTVICEDCAAKRGRVFPIEIRISLGNKEVVYNHIVTEDAIMNREPFYGCFLEQVLHPAKEKAAAIFDKMIKELREPSEDYYPRAVVKHKGGQPWRTMSS